MPLELKNKNVMNYRSICIFKKLKFCTESFSAIGHSFKKSAPYKIGL